MSARTCLAIVLAAGEGTRMLSSRPKVLHAVAGRSLLGHVLAALRAAGGTQTAVVVGPGHDGVAAEARAQLADAEKFRAGRTARLTDPKGAAEATVPSLTTLVLPDMATTVTPIVYAIPVQLIAYHTAVNMGTDVDQPRNLAKSVTVE